MTTGVVQQAKAEQTLALGQRQLQGLALLAMSLPELRQAVSAELAANPAIEDTDHPLETPLSEVQSAADARERDQEPDYLVDDFTPGLSADDAAAERRQAFFDNQVRQETLQDHLLAQLPLSDIPEADWPLVEVLVGDLDANGYYRGSLPDVQMAFGKTADDLDGVLASLREFDPPGCGARTPRECLLAQLDKLSGDPALPTVSRLVTDHLEDIAAGRRAEIERALGITREQFVAALKALRTLNPHPGRDFPSERDRVEYVNPEVHAVKKGGAWHAVTDRRSLPTLRFSEKFEALLADPKQTPETKAYVRERIASARALQEAIERRADTLGRIAEAIFARQQDFFEKGFPALKPMTELEIAAEVGVHGTTVSRTVRDKYAATPKGTVELRRFFVSAVKTASGETLSQEAALAALGKIIAAEDKSAPLSDEKLSEKMKAAGFPVARRTVAKYRDRLGIPGASDRRSVLCRG